MVPRRLDPPCERQARRGADRELQLVAIEAAALAGADGAAVPPGGVRVTEPLALPASVTDVALTIRKCGKGGGVYRYVTPKIRVLLSERSGYRVDAIRESGMVRPELPGKAVTGPYARAGTEPRL